MTAEAVTRRHPLRATLAGVLLFAIGAAIGAGAVMNYQRERDNLAGWTRTSGQVMQLLETSAGQRPVVGFTAPDGTRIRFTALAARGSSYRVGDAVTVMYPSDDPSGARLDVPLLRWGRPAFAAAGSIVLMALGAYVAWYARKTGLGDG